MAKDEKQKASKVVKTHRTDGEKKKTHKVVPHPGKKPAHAPVSKTVHHIPHHGEHLQKCMVNLYSIKGEENGKVTLPQAFNEEFRPDIIRRAVNASRANRRQPYGHSPVSGLRRSVYWAGKGRGVSRVPRLMDGMRGAQAPNTVGGRPGWGPDIRKDWTKKINEKERKKAINSALRATRDAEIVRHRGHLFNSELTLPIVIENKAENLKTTKEVLGMIENLGLLEDVQRSKASIHIRAGVGKMRNRPYRERRSILIVAKKTEELSRAAGNLPGVDVVPPWKLSAEMLAPGGDAGRLTLFTEDALDIMRKW